MKRFWKWSIQLKEKTFGTRSLFRVQKSRAICKSGLFTTFVACNQIWLQQGLDLRIKSYSVVATGVNTHGEGVGMIEVVQNCWTVNKIHQSFGGNFRGALANDPILKYIKHNNPQQGFPKAMQNFVRSCAGSCVATYLLGIGDRHTDNMMIQNNGLFVRMFHTRVCFCPCLTFFGVL